MYAGNKEIKAVGAAVFGVGITGPGTGVFLTGAPPPASAFSFVVFPVLGIVPEKAESFRARSVETAFVVGGNFSASFP